MEENRSGSHFLLYFVKTFIINHISGYSGDHEGVGMAHGGITHQLASVCPDDGGVVLVRLNKL